MNSINDLMKQLEALQPISSENQRRLDQKCMLEFNYNSNHMEGNTLTYGQTRLLLMFGETSGDAKLRDYEEMKAHNVGLELVKREAREKDRPLTESFIRELNRTILVENFYKTRESETGANRYEVKVGQYKMYPNSVLTATDEIFEYASPEEIPAMMTDLVEWYNVEEKKGELNPVELASLLHYRFIRIHPFDDGNGRIARLLVNFVFLRHNYPMVIVQSQDKENYLNVLHKCDIEVGFIPSDGAYVPLEKITPFVEYMEKLLEYALTISIKAAKGESIEEDNDFAKTMTLLEREAKQKETRVMYSEEQVWNVLEYFYFPLKENIVDALKPANKFFSQVVWSNQISKTNSRKGSLHLNMVMRENPNSQIKDFVRNAKSMFFYYDLKYPSNEYNMTPDLSIRVEFNIAFEDDHYTVSVLDNKKFKYTTYPAQTEKETIVNKFKNEVLTRIEKAIHAGR